MLNRSNKLTLTGHITHTKFFLKKKYMQNRSIVSHMSHMTSFTFEVCMLPTV